MKSLRNTRFFAAMLCTSVVVVVLGGGLITWESFLDQESSIRVGMTRAEVEEILEKKGDAIAGRVVPHIRPTSGFVRIEPGHKKAHWVNKNYSVEVIFDTNNDGVVSVAYTDKRPPFLERLFDFLR